LEVARPSWLRRRKIASPAHGFVLLRIKPLALRFFFNEAFRFDAQTYTDWKHQSASRISIEVSREPAGHSGVSAPRLPAILMAAAFSALFARRTKCI
jgi:hypothetical protein